MEEPQSKLPPPPPTPPTTPLSLVKPSSKNNKKRPVKIFRAFRNVFRSFPIITPVCKLPSLPGGRLPENKTGVTGTLFGYRKGRVSLSIQENPGTLPNLVIDLAMQTNVLQKEMSLGMVRIALECEKRPDNNNNNNNHKEKTKLLDEPLWTMFVNGKKSGYCARRDATEEDLHLMEVLKAVSMGAGVLPPTKSDMEGHVDDEMAYMRAHFERVVGSKDSETLYMLSPDGSSEPELSIFFVRI
ncbi:PREDICTED: protein MIZU-KUSSEI 1-like [Nicotiana attenuata]|uniref:Protein mizu-kussei 1 n=1 Tax=Nicotiana attenuata TaxID=49451 RepID=A0A1J6HWP0_NICAT|nr:PREDICTED: protein MIZU-KUSSEI 1-like [Nicotiana attenuata]OIS97268.1 protein mizu-kussei 1 [Nicotiana attenuata]